MTSYQSALRLIFPEFEEKKESRFCKFFNKNNYYETKEENKYELNGHKIFTGEDKRSTILIKNLPRSMTKNQLKLILEKIANINFIYIPLFMLSADNLRCAFVNVVNSKSRLFGCVSCFVFIVTFIFVRHSLASLCKQRGWSLFLSRTAWKG